MSAASFDHVGIPRGEARSIVGERRWMRGVLYAAAAYNLVWGAVVVVAPNLFFDVAGLPRPTYPSIWQCVGMIVGVYGVGYAAAARAPLAHWPIVLVGLLGKVFGPIGFLMAASRGELPWTFGATIVTNDLVWWAPFAAILWCAWKSASDPHPGERSATGRGLDALSTHPEPNAARIREAQSRRPVLVVFLRHTGCTFCREALSDLAAARRAIEGAGVELALVHPGLDAIAARRMIEAYGLEGVRVVADPDASLYRAFDLSRGSFSQLFGARVWLRGLVAFAKGHGVGLPDGDGFRMPGAFVLYRDRIVRSFVHGRASDRPDYEELASSVPLNRRSPAPPSATATR